jgi:hypothetical protein
LALSTWAQHGSVESFFAVIGKHSNAPAPPASPLAWGNTKHVDELLGRDFELKFERGVNNAYHPDVNHIWEWYARGFGPLRQLIDSLDPERRSALRKDLDAYHGHYATEAGLHVKREYVVILGRRR